MIDSPNARHDIRCQCTDAIAEVGEGIASYQLNCIVRSSGTNDTDVVVANGADSASAMCPMTANMNGVAILSRRIESVDVCVWRRCAMKNKASLNFNAWGATEKGQWFTTTQQLGTDRRRIHCHRRPRPGALSALPR